MKFIWHWEWITEDIEKMREISKKVQKAMKDHPEKFPKLSEPNFTGRGKGFRIIEADNEEQLVNLLAIWHPTEKWNLVPCLDGNKWIEAFEKWHE